MEKYVSKTERELVLDKIKLEYERACVAISKMAKVEGFWEDRAVRLNNTRRSRLVEEVRAIDVSSRKGQFLSLFRARVQGMTMSPRKALEYKKYYLLPEATKDDWIQKDSDPSDVLKNPSVPINESKVRINKFFHYICDTANMLKVQRVYDVGVRDKIIIVGRPGLGKTALINYIFSWYGVRFIKRNIIWIRVDLNNVLTGNGEFNGLEERLAAQAYSIMSRFYYRDVVEQGLRHSILDDMVLFVREYDLCGRLKSLHMRDERYVYNFCDTMLEFMGDLMFEKWERVKPTLSHLVGMLTTCVSVHRCDTSVRVAIGKEPAQCLLDFAKLLMSYWQRVRNAGYVIVFDGMDSVTFAGMHFDVYSGWMTELQKITENHNEKMYMALYLITMREYSALRLDRGSTRPEDMHGHVGTYTVLHLNRFEPTALLQKKINYIADDFERRFSDIDNVRGRVKRIVENIVCLLMNAAKGTSLDLPTVSLDEDGAAIDNALGSIFSTNYRLLFVCVRDVLLLIYSRLGDASFDELSKEDCLFFRNSLWMVHRLLVTGTPHTKLFRNQYEYTDDGVAYVNEVYPVMLNAFNYNENALGGAVQGALPRSLIKIKIIKELGGGSQYIRSLLGTMAKIYKTDCSVLRYETRELIYFDILRPDEESVVFEPDTNKYNYRVSLTPKHQSLISLLGTSAYYEAVIDSSPIMHALSSEFYSLHWSEVSLSKYLNVKSRHLVWLIAYYTILEAAEKSNYASSFSTDSRTRAESEFVRKYSMFNSGLREKVFAHIADSICGNASINLPRFIASLFS